MTDPETSGVASRKHRFYARKNVQLHLGTEHSHAMVPGRPRRGIVVLALLLATLAHLLAQLFWPSGLLANATQILLMPLLAGAVISFTTSPRGRLIRLVLAALFFSWVGDALPRFMDGDPAFLAMVGAFLVAQFFYIGALARYWKSSILRRWWMLFPYLAAFAVLLILCSPGAGALLAPVIIYGLALMVMAILSTGLGPVAGSGGAIFFLSDSLIALRSFTDIGIPAMGFWIMLTYVAGQTMISYAASQRDAQEKSTTTCR